MRILEIDAAGAPAGVDGVSAVLWSVSGELARMGHVVTLVLRSPLTERGKMTADALGLEMVPAYRSDFSVNIPPLLTAIRRNRPDILHVHGSLHPQMAAGAALAMLTRVPYLYSSHGGLSPLLVQRGWQRRLYAHTVERVVAQRAKAALYCVGPERLDVRRIAPNLRGIEAVIPPPVDPATFAAPPWSGPSDPGSRPIVFLGRYEIFQKGLDRLVDIARAAPELRFALYGETSDRDRPRVDSLKASAPANIRFNPPVYGAEKHAVLAGAAMYIQASRYEGFPVSVAEALVLGVPCAISPDMGLAAEFRDLGLGLVLPAATGPAVAALRKSLADPIELGRWSQQERGYAAAHFTASAVAERYIELYLRVLADSNRT